MNPVVESAVGMDAEAVDWRSVDCVVGGGPSCYVSDDSGGETVGAESCDCGYDVA